MGRTAPRERLLMWHTLPDLFVTAVRTGGKGMGGVSLLVIERSKGVNTTKMACQGVWASGTTFVEFDDVKVPVENLLGKENKGFQLIMSNFNPCVLVWRGAEVRRADFCLRYHPASASALLFNPTASLAFASRSRSSTHPSARRSVSCCATTLSFAQRWLVWPHESRVCMPGSSPVSISARVQFTLLTDGALHPQSSINPLNTTPTRSPCAAAAQSLSSRQKQQTPSTSVLARLRKFSVDWPTPAAAKARRSRGCTARSGRTLFLEDRLRLCMTWVSVRVSRLRRSWGASACIRKRAYD